jgi:hypothetical protein
MAIQKSHSASPNEVHLHANNLYRLMIEVRALRDEVRLLEVPSEAKAPGFDLHKYKSISGNHTNDSVSSHTR